MASMPNPLLQLDLPLPFAVIQAAHVEEAVDQLLASAQKAIDAIVADKPKTYEASFAPLERATESLEPAVALIDHLESSATTPEFRQAYNAVQPKLSAFFSALRMNQALYFTLRDAAHAFGVESLDATAQRFVQKTLEEFRRQGAELEGKGKDELSQIDVALSECTTRFAQNLLDATRAYECWVEDEARLAGLPPFEREAARQRARDRGREAWLFTLAEPSLIAALTYLDDASLREAIWRAHQTRATQGEVDNRGLIARILELRQRKAALLGYSNFGDFVLADRMAKHAARAGEFIEALRQKTQPFFLQEKEALHAFRRSLEGDDAPELQPWDLGYYAEKQRRARYDLDEEELRPYFQVDRVLRGMFEIAGRLFALRVEETKAPTWHPDVRVFSLYDEGGRDPIALFFVDLFPRDDKRGGAWMAPLLTHAATPGARKPQVGVFCANLSSPTADRPALLSMREVETLFHEFGHLLHHSLSAVNVRSLAGTNVAWDFVELPSQIMENWCWEREALDLFARHYQSDAAIPDALFDKLQRSRTFRAASQMMRQLGFAALDLALHTRYEPARDGDVLHFARSVLQDYLPAPLPEDYAMIAGFGHLFASPVGYAAGYYSYKWAEVLDADAFERFRERGVFDRESGLAFRQIILQQGDSRDPAELYEAFRGRPPQSDALFARMGLQSAA